MPETRRFDPLGWFLSACCTVLAGAVALTVAVHLIAAIWTSLVLIGSVMLLLTLVGWLLLWCHRRRRW